MALVQGAELGESIVENRESARPRTGLTPNVSEHFSKGQIDASRAGEWMLPVLEQCDAVIDEACGTAQTAMSPLSTLQASHWIGATFAAPQEYPRAGRVWNPRRSG
jgi:hypothetical protein